MPPLPGSAKFAHFHEVLQVPGRGRARRAGDGDVILGAEPAFEPVWPLAEHALNHLGLTVVKPVAELCFGDEEGNPRQCDLLSVQHRLAEPQQSMGPESVAVTTTSCRTRSWRLQSHTRIS